MKILYVASECAPFAASGGLGDVLGALPAAIAHSGRINNVEVAIPLYSSIPLEHKEKLEAVRNVTFKLSWRSTGATVYKLNRDGVTYYFFENHYYFDRNRLYGEYDDGERFAFFSRAVLEFLKYEATLPDVIHANDWQTALTVIYLKTEYKNDSRFKSIKTLYTIHNIEYQGKFASSILGDVFGIDERYRTVLEYDNCLNLTKGALTVSDYISTVSPNYANELKYDYFAFGLAKVISSVSDKTCGVINGIDYGYFSPENDKDVYAQYTSDTLVKGKRENKLALQRELGLEIRDGVPLLVMVTRLTEGKGIDLVLHILDELLGEDIQLVILGTGDEKYERALKISENGRHNFKALLKFDRVLSKKIYAAADIFLMPSKSEPCGLAQMIACRYAAIPIVHSVGGLYDTIISYGEPLANGFKFGHFNAHELLFVIKMAIEVYHNKEKWLSLCKNAMASDFSWNKSAQKYISIYEKITKR